MGAAQSTLHEREPSAEPYPPIEPLSHVPPSNISASHDHITVDLRHVNPDINIQISKHNAGDTEIQIRSIAGMVTVVGQAVVTLLTIQKLWEEIIFTRSLRNQMSSLLPEMENGALRRQDSSPGLTAKSIEDIMAPQALSMSDTTWESIAGLRQVKLLLQEAAVLPTLRPDMFHGVLQPPKGILLYGPPGTGKTMLAKAVAKESRAAFLAVTGNKLMSMWFGQSEQNVSALFKKARQQQPCVIFIDEVDSLLGKRDGHGLRSLTNELLSHIDGIQSGNSDRIIIIAATNFPWDLDEAALSRFSYRLFVPLPDASTRTQLMHNCMKDVKHSVGVEDWRQLTERTAGYSGRDLVQVCRAASMQPLRELWGERLLESGQGADLVAEQRLVELIATALDKHPGQKQRLAKEVERWRKKSKVTWCKTPAIMKQAEERALALQKKKMSDKHSDGAEAEQHTDSPASGSGSGSRHNKQEGSADQGTEKDVCSSSTSPSPNDSNAVKHTQDTRDSSPAAPKTEGPPAGIKNDGPETAPSSPGVVQEVAGERLHDWPASSACTGNGCEVYGTSTSGSSGCCERDSGSSATSQAASSSVPSAAAADSSMSGSPASTSSSRSPESTSCSPSPASQDASADVLTSTTERFNALPISSPHAENCTTSSSSAKCRPEPSNADSIKGTTDVLASSADQQKDERASAAVALVPDDKDRQAKRQDPTREKGPKKVKEGKTGQQDQQMPALVWKVSELMSLQANELRPVTLKDFERALEEIAGSELGLSNQFEEWGNSYGTQLGGAKREKYSWRTHMYL